MSRDDVHHNSHRCPRCCIPPRWCICEELREVSTDLKVDVLMHEREAHRPTSTGHLLTRVVSHAQMHEWKAGEPVKPEVFRVQERELWVLHPNGEDLPAAQPAGGIQVLLIDGSWKQATAMMKTLQGCGRRVRLPMSGPSRFWLRNQHDEGHYSTAEALLHFMKAFGLTEAHDQLRMQFELHVYAVLCARGEKVKAAEYLLNSPIATAMPGLVAKLNHCRKDYYY